jgi:hypothetical protein
MKTQYVYATANVGTCDADGIGYSLREGAVWHALDPLVLLRPGLFSETPPGPNFPRRTVLAVEEVATPGERRGLRRAR